MCVQGGVCVQEGVCVQVRVCVCARLHVCVRVCVHAHVHACVGARIVSVHCLCEASVMFNQLHVLLFHAERRKK